MISKMKYNSLRNAFLTMLFSVSLSQAGAQTLQQGRELINKKDYASAVTAFSKLIKQYGSRADVNKWYGEALYETGQYDKAEKYIEIAAKRKVTGAYPYMAKICMRKYMFADAASWWEKYKLSLKKAPAEEASAEHLIQQARYCEDELGRVEQVAIIDSLIVDKDNFFKYYKLSQESGKLIDYKMLQDAQENTQEGVFESQRGDRRVFAQKGENGYDLYETSRLVGAKWSEPTPFPQNINTAANERFPFVMNDGFTLYFSSDQQPSLGGYDLYVTKYNVSSGTYFTPEKLPMPFNSPYNDYLMAIDEGHQVGWFATDRFQPEDKVIIYVFIPNTGERNYYRDRPEQEVRDLAMITSIRATWPQDANYDKLLYSIYNEEEQDQQKKGDFVFIINDNIIYRQMSDFEDAQARKKFEQASALRSQYEQNKTDLEQLRKKWSFGKQSERAKIKSRILQLENITEEQSVNLQDLENDARNTEIMFLRKKH